MNPMKTEKRIVQNVQKKKPYKMIIFGFYKNYKKKVNCN